jgi:DNA repair protein RadC
LYLDKRHRLIQFEELFRGTIDGASVHPREVVKLALQRNAAAVIVAHNHPLCCVAVSPSGFGVTADKAWGGPSAGLDR